MEMAGHIKALDMPKQYPVICSWCGKEYKKGPAKNSHGICATCQEKVLAEEYDEKPNLLSC